MNKSMHNTILAAATAAVLFSSLSGCGPAGQETKSPPPVRVVTVPAEATRLEEMLLTTGDVVAMNTVLLKATVEGPISFFPWREGDRAEQDEKLIEIDRPLYRQELASAEAALAVAQAKLDDLKAGARPEEIAQARESVRHFADCTEFAEADLKRIRALVESGAVPSEAAEKARVDFIKCQTQLKAAQEQLEMLEAGPTRTEIAVAQATVSEAEARRNLARAKLDECLIHAPFSGVVTEVFVRPGDLAVPRQPLLKIMEPDSLVIRTGLPENCAAELRTGSPAEVKLDAYPGKTFSAKIERIYPRLESGSRTRLVELRVTDPVDLLPRMFARISITGRIIENAVVIPSKAITATPRGDQQVFVAEQGRAIKRKIQPGLEQDGRVQILSGIKAGESVIIEGNLNLKDGTIVNAVAPAEAAGGVSK